MRKNRSQYASMKYPNLYKYPDNPSWMFRKYCKEKRKEFIKSTGEKDEAKAYRIGLEQFNQWLGSTLETGNQVLMKDLFRSILASKENTKNGKKGSSYRSAHNQILNHLMPAFGHLRPEQITPRLWKDYDACERRKIRYSKHGKTIRRTRMFNTRKHLIEALRLASENKVISSVPKLKSFDPKAKPPKYLQRESIRAILHRIRSQTKLLFFIMWKQGARPEEILQYEWSMLFWDEKNKGFIKIPAEITKTNRERVIPLNSRVSRILRYLMPSARSTYLFPSPSMPKQRQKNYKTCWNTACRQLQINATPYNLRDTFITDCLMRGFSPTFIGKYTDTSAVMIDGKYAVAEEKMMQQVAG